MVILPATHFHPLGHSRTFTSLSIGSGHKYPERYPGILLFRRKEALSKQL
jgi:hypothetical protein